MLTREQIDQATAEGRHVRVRAAGDVLADFFTAGRELRLVVTSGLPEGAVLASVEVIALGPDRSTIDFLYVHPDFEARAEGGPIPILPVTFETIPVVESDPG